MHIGLIGGIGPAATVAYYTGLIEAFNKVDEPLEVTIVHADGSVLAANASGNKTRAQAKVFAKHLAQLEGAGCDVAMITALTGHFCFNEAQSLSAIPMINGVEVIDRYCAEHQIKVIGLLGSPPVLATRLFGLLKASRTVVPESDLENLGKAYMEMATSGVCSEDIRQKFFKAGTTMTEHQNAEAILLAGTDLGLAFDGHKPGYRVIDALELHIEALVALQMET
jgi:aspartate racemase